MNEEVKEILESSRKIIKSNRENGFNRIIMLGDDIDKLLDYITNLQQENEELKKQYCERTYCSGRIGNSKKVEELQNENQQLKKVIDKAIEELKKGLHELDIRRREEVYIEQYIGEALNILKEVE